jgi:ricin-type beta-trefoil lectin protein
MLAVMTAAGRARRVSYSGSIMNRGINKGPDVTDRSRHRCKALTVESIRDNNRANVIQRSWNYNAQQRWRLEQVGDNYYRIVSVDNGKCLDVAGAGNQNGANVHLWIISATNKQ